MATFMEALLADLVKVTLLDVAALFPIVNPVRRIPIFLSLTRGGSADTRRLLARRVAVNGFILLVGAIFVGTYILALFGVSLPIVQVSGGLVMTATAWSLLTRKYQETSDDDAVGSTDRDLVNQAFYPLTFPLTLGSGSLSAAVTLGANVPQRMVTQAELVVASLLAPAIMSLAIYLSYRWSERLERFMGESAMGVFLRLSAFILLCIGIQVFWNGVSALWLTLPG